MVIQRDIHNMILHDISNIEKDTSIKVSTYPLSKNSTMDRLIFPHEYGFAPIDKLVFEYDSEHHSLHHIIHMFDIIHGKDVSTLDNLNIIEIVKIAFLLRTYASEDIYHNYTKHNKLRIYKEDEEPDYMDYKSISKFLYKNCQYVRDNPYKYLDMKRCIEEGLFNESKYFVYCIFYPGIEMDDLEYIAINTDMCLSDDYLCKFFEIYGYDISQEQDIELTVQELKNKIKPHIGKEKLLAVSINTIEDLHIYLKSLDKDYDFSLDQLENFLLKNE